MSSVEDTELKGGRPPAGKYLFYVVIGTKLKVNSEPLICNLFLCGWQIEIILSSVKAGGMRITQHKGPKEDKEGKITKEKEQVDEGNATLKVSTR